MGIHIDRLKRDTAGLPLVIGEFGFDPLSQVDDEDQAKAFEAYYDVLRAKDVITP